MLWFADFLSALQSGLTLPDVIDFDAHDRFTVPVSAWA
jgi:hypothetical protein